MRTANLSSGEHEYADVVRGWEQGMFPFAQIRTASGCTRPLVGISPEQCEAIRAALRRLEMRCLLTGSRVAGPRSVQRQIHPALAHTPLFAMGRRSSAGYPAVSGLRIEKTKIKEWGVADPRTSDLSIVLIHSPSHTEAQLLTAAVDLEKLCATLGCSFPVRVYFELDRTRFCSEESYVQFGVEHFLARELPDLRAFSEPALALAIRSTIAPLQ